MAVKPFFEDSESSYFDAHGRPRGPGRYEFRRSDGMKLLYTLDWMPREEGEEPRLRVVHCNRISEFPSPAHALNTLDGTWVRWLGPVAAEEGREEDGAAAGENRT
jgi:hypothetical protein